VRFSKNILARAGFKKILGGSGFYAINLQTRDE
jgi:hypothetical protein